MFFSYHSALSPQSIRQNPLNIRFNNVILLEGRPFLLTAAGGGSRINSSKPMNSGEQLEGGESAGAEALSVLKDASASSPAEPASLLNTRICDLGLTIEGSAVEKFVQQLYRELEQKKVTKFRPPCYLTDEWGCPSGEPTLGIAFYQARTDL
jgi:hypothetical protein